MRRRECRKRRRGERSVRSSENPREKERKRYQMPKSEVL